MTISIVLRVAAALLISAGMTQAQEPLILLDAAHHNVFGSRGRDNVARYLERSGYRVEELQEPFSRSVLRGVRVVVIAAAVSARNALPSGFTQEEFNRAWSRPTPSALSRAEIESLRAWVNEGGGLLLVFDHMPLPGAARDLAAAFGIEVSNGYAVDARKLTDLSTEAVSEAASVVFYRTDRTLADDPITNGRVESERVDSVATWVGSAVRMPPAGRSLLTLTPSFVSLLPDTAWVFSDATPRQDIGGWSQGAVLNVGQGRVAVFAELGILVSREQMARSSQDRETNPQVQNPQLMLNVVRWLSGGLR